MANIERRPHLQRLCPFPGCDWLQTTSWFVGGPLNIQPADGRKLMAEAEAHFLAAHLGQTPPKIFV